MRLIYKLAASVAFLSIAAIAACVGDSGSTASSDGGSADGGGNGDDGASNVDGSTTSGSDSGGDSGGGKDAGGCSSPNVTCGTACVDPATFSTDSKNCGICGHDCLGAACKNKKCDAMQVYGIDAGASVGPPVWSIGVDAKNVYFMLANAFGQDGGLEQCPITGCVANAPLTVDTGSNLGIAVSPPFVLYATGQNDAVRRYYPDGDGGQNFSCTGFEKICGLGGTPNVSGITANSTTAFFGAGVPGFATGNAVVRAPLPNGGNVATGTTSAASTLVSMALDPTATFLYVVDQANGKVVAFPTNGTGATAPSAFANAQGTPSSVVVAKNGLVYWANNTAPAGIFSLPMCPGTGCPGTVGSPTTVYATSSATSVIADDTKIYFGAAATVYSCPQTGCGAGPTTLYEGTYNIKALAQDAVSIYFGDDHGNVSRLAK